LPCSRRRTALRGVENRNSGSIFFAAISDTQTSKLAVIGIGAHVGTRLRACAESERAPPAASIGSPLHGSIIARTIATTNKSCPANILHTQPSKTIQWHHSRLSNPLLARRSRCMRCPLSAPHKLHDEVPRHLQPSRLRRSTTSQMYLYLVEWLAV
jgi:hypothetical protein